MSHVADISEGAQWVEGTDRSHVEPEGVEAGQILGFVITIALLVVLAIVALFQYTDRTAQAVLTEAAEEGVYPELEEARLHAALLLAQYEALDGPGERYRIPIERAMQRMVQEAPVYPEAFYAAEYMATYRRQ